MRHLERWHVDSSYAKHGKRDTTHHQIERNQLRPLCRLEKTACRL